METEKTQNLNLSLWINSTNHFNNGNESGKNYIDVINNGNSSLDNIMMNYPNTNLTDQSIFNSSFSSETVLEETFFDHNWNSLRKEHPWALSIHIYGFSCLFFMLAFYTFFSILNLR